ncbi:MAG: class I SAM-dependent methyltransferase [Gammaproteobacteria bacterium]|nr:class I SAM-dependent methyltransferase [Gammaproteobacteria bacterium]MDH5652891.1 class I SAM-dependent methyltransferase [Gammaproteobacteria bacterium]
MKKPKNDRALRFYNEVLGLEHLHYGIWNDDDELTIANLKLAQKRYEDLLADNIPADVKTTLESGCGTGAMWTRMLAMGLDAEALSPDVNQMEMLTKKIKAPFHFCRFEDFEPSKQYDMVLMSESCQYVPLDQIFSRVKRSLRSKGYWMICDYFTLDNAEGVMAKSGHNFNKFMQLARENGFELLKERDITREATRTLDFARDLVRKGRTGVDIITEKFRHDHPLMTRFVGWLLRKKIRKLNESEELLDSKKFMAGKKYIFLLFQRGD